MRTSLRALAGALVALGASGITTSATAQSDDTTPTAFDRSGWFASIGLGAASTGLHCPDCGDLDRVTGPAANVTVGYALSPRLRLGVDFTGWSEDMGWAKKTVQAYSLVGQLYPSLSRGGWLRLGAGHGKLSVRETGAFEQAGTVFTLASGWDVRVRDRFSVAPYAQYLHQLPSDATGSGAHEGKGRVTMFQLGVGVTYGR